MCLHLDLAASTIRIYQCSQLATCQQRGLYCYVPMHTLLETIARIAVWIAIVVFTPIVVVAVIWFWMQLTFIDLWLAIGTAILLVIVLLLILAAVDHAHDEDHIH